MIRGGGYDGRGAECIVCGASIRLERDDIALVSKAWARRQFPADTLVDFVAPEGQMGICKACVVTWRSIESGMSVEEISKEEEDDDDNNLE